ncbi:hypothetical protein MP228_011732 [Amoeboaphelidium protococcarum]|nr:hypothetical protein MP228_011732 [Amoeboaphelidium protococcarum]
MAVSKFSFALVIAVIVSLLNSVIGYGFGGHRMVAAIAQSLLTESTVRQLEAILKYDGFESSSSVRAVSAGNNDDDYQSNGVASLIGGDPNYQLDLQRISTWADQIKRSAKYRFTSQLHYVNPLDNEPQKCSYNYARDCPIKFEGDRFGTCIVGALKNYTQRLLTSDDISVQIEALKFIVHFVGDIHQPLHASGRQRGGNDYSVRFFNAKSNLHAVWDGLLLDKIVRQMFHSYDKSGIDESDASEKSGDSDDDDDLARGVDYAPLTDYLITKINDGWDGQVGKWETCSYPRMVFQDPSSPLMSSEPFLSVQDLTSAVCPDLWARESNQYNCKSVWPKDGIQTLGQDYVDANQKIAIEIVAKSGVRLAAILNSIMDARERMRIVGEVRSELQQL